MEQGERDVNPRAATRTAGSAHDADRAPRLAALFALNDVAVLPFGYSAISDTVLAGVSFVAVPAGTVAAVLLLVLFVRRLRLEWATGVAICIGLVMVLSFPPGLLVASVLHLARPALTAVPGRDPTVGSNGRDAGHEHHAPARCRSARARR